MAPPFLVSDFGLVLEMDGQLVLSGQCPLQTATVWSWVLDGRVQPDLGPMHRSVTGIHGRKLRV